MQLFALEGKSLVLRRPLDRDEKDISTIRFEIQCGVSGRTQVSVPIIIRIQDINDNAPVFVGAPYEVSLPENTPPGSIVFRDIHATDTDAGLNGQVKYQIVSPDGGINPFAIRLPHQGALSLVAPLDYERAERHTLHVIASDYARDPLERLNSSTTLRVHVQDVDDQNPLFDTAQSPCLEDGEEPPCLTSPPTYRAAVTEGVIAGVIDILPSRIHAHDQDTLDAPIRYTFVDGSPPFYETFFRIDPRTAVVTQQRPVDTSFTDAFDITIQAEEQSPRRGRSLARLLVSVVGVDTSPPIISANSYSGRVREASPVGTVVMATGGGGAGGRGGSRQPLRFSVTDPDVNPGDPVPTYIFELTTSAFRVSPDGVLQVASNNLDRDPPNLPVYSFQALARESTTGGVASTPITITVQLDDVNDNAPHLPVVPAVTVPAGAQRRTVLRLNASDTDEGKNAEFLYSLVGSTNEGTSRFSIEPSSGILSAVRELHAGENFVLTIRVTDSGGLYNEGVVEISVSKGPNTAGPQFLRRSYTASVSENASFGSKIITVKAKDPEGDVPYYSMEEEKSQVRAPAPFAIDTLSGVISVIAPLDREAKDRFHFVVHAVDTEGLSSNASVFLKVLDVNDEAPQFVGLPFSFRVDEGQSRALVGTVSAKDADLGAAGEVMFSIQQEKAREKELPFAVNVSSGKIYTTLPLDYEKEQVHLIRVVASDKADDPQQSTATVTVLVNDLNDEVPMFLKEEYSAVVPESAEVGSLLLTVEAHDPDTRSEITYELQKGDATLFKVSSKEGRVTLKRKLDYERRRNHTLVVGTKENNETGPGHDATIHIKVSDVNDNYPKLNIVRTVTVPQSVSLGTLIVALDAQDNDASHPNNKVVFSVSGKSSELFSVNEEKGGIVVAQSLRNINLTELNLDVDVSDMGEPPLSDSSSVRVVLLPERGEVTPSFGGDLQLGTPQLISSPSFAKETFEIKVREDIELGSAVLKIPVINSTMAIACSILNGNDNGSFASEMSRDGNCELLVTGSVDFELSPAHHLSVVLHPSGVPLPTQDTNVDTFPALSYADVLIEVLDLNDNAPVFSLQKPDKFVVLPDNTVLTYVAQKAPIDTKVVQLKASDSDSGAMGNVVYSLLPESNRGSFFSVDVSTGRLITKRPLVNVPKELLPFNLSLLAMDTMTEDKQKASLLHVIVSVIEDSQRSIVVFDAPKDKVEDHIEVIEDIISHETKNIVEVERLKQDHITTTEGDLLTHTHVWLHQLNPKTYMPVQNSKPQKAGSQDRILKSLSSSIKGANAISIKTPSELHLMQVRLQESLLESAPAFPTSTSPSLTQGQAFTPSEYALFVLACVIVAFVICAIVALCVMWSNYNRRWHRENDKLVMLVPPVVDRPSSVLETISKEYETQVLHMSIPLDDESMHELPTPSTRQHKHHFSMDNVSYISKSHNGYDGSSNGGSSERGTPRGDNIMEGEFMGENNWEYVGQQRGGMFGGGEGGGSGMLSASTTNNNVMFGRRGGLGGGGLHEQSPVETTTEL